MAGVGIAVILSPQDEIGTVLMTANRTITPRTAGCDRAHAGFGAEADHAPAVREPDRQSGAASASDARWRRRFLPIGRGADRAAACNRGRKQQLALVGLWEPPGRA